MQRIEFKIFDGSRLNIGCAFQDYINSEIERLRTSVPGLESIKCVHISRDYFVFQLKFKEIEEDVPP